MDARTGIRLSVGDAINAGILDKAQLAYKNTCTGQLMSLNEAYTLGFVKGNLCSKNYSLAATATAAATAAGKSKLVYTREANGNASVLESEEEDKCFRIEKMFDPRVKSLVSLDQAIERGIFNRERGMYVDTMANRELTIKEAHALGLVKAEPISTTESKVLKINVAGAAAAKAENSEKTAILSKKEFLYEIKEIAQVTMGNNTGDDLVRRIELVVDEDDEMKTAAQQQQRQHQPVRMRHSFKDRSALERQIPSVAYDATETLVIDDVRQSRMLDIDATRRVIKNEISIEPDTNRNAVLIDNVLVKTSNNNNNSIHNNVHRRSGVSSKEGAGPLKISVQSAKKPVPASEAAENDQLAERERFERALRQLEIFDGVQSICNSVRD